MPQLVLGRLPDGEMVFRVARPGYDAIGEPLGSAGIGFDSRIDVQGIAWMAGQCGVGQPVYYPFSPRYTPMLRFFEVSGANLYEGELYGTNNAGGVQTNFTWPWVGICYADHFVIQQQTNPFYNFSSSGGAFAYMLFRGMV